MSYLPLFVIFLSGLAGIMLVATVGAIASRVFKFKYAWLSIVSVVVYTMTGYYFSQTYGLPIALYMNGLLGLVDGTAGFWLSIRVDANNGVVPEKAKQMLGPQSAIVCIVSALVFGLIGHGIGA